MCVRERVCVCERGRGRGRGRERERLLGMDLVSMVALWVELICL